VRYSFAKELQLLEFVQEKGFLSVHFVGQPSVNILSSLYCLFIYYPKVINLLIC
jgi:hypothetical protein